MAESEERPLARRLDLSAASAAGCAESTPLRGWGGVGSERSALVGLQLAALLRTPAGLPSSPFDPLSATPAASSAVSRLETPQSGCETAAELLPVEQLVARMRTGFRRECRAVLRLLRTALRRAPRGDTAGAAAQARVLCPGIGSRERTYVLLELLNGVLFLTGPAGRAAGLPHGEGEALAALLLELALPPRPGGEADPLAEAALESSEAWAAVRERHFAALSAAAEARRQRRLALMRGALRQWRRRAEGRRASQRRGLLPLPPRPQTWKQRPAPPPSPPPWVPPSSWGSTAPPPPAPPRPSSPPPSPPANLPPQPASPPPAGGEAGPPAGGGGQAGLERILAELRVLVAEAPPLPASPPPPPGSPPPSPGSPPPRRGSGGGSSGASRGTLAELSEWDAALRLRRAECDSEVHRRRRLLLRALRQWRQRLARRHRRAAAAARTLGRPAMRRSLALWRARLHQRRQGAELHRRLALRRGWERWRGAARRAAAAGEVAAVRSLQAARLPAVWLHWRRRRAGRCLRRLLLRAIWERLRVGALLHRGATRLLRRVVARWRRGTKLRAAAEAARRGALRRALQRLRLHAAWGRAAARAADAARAARLLRRWRLRRCALVAHRAACRSLSARAVSCWRVALAAREAGRALRCGTLRRSVRAWHQLLASPAHLRPAATAGAVRAVRLRRAAALLVLWRRRAGARRAERAAVARCALRALWQRWRRRCATAAALSAAGRMRLRRATAAKRALFAKWHCAARCRADARRLRRRVVLRACLSVLCRHAQEARAARARAPPPVRSRPPRRRRSLAPPPPPPPPPARAGSRGAAFWGAPPPCP
eukprot:TRINITY_DN9255_c0_g4_i1.p1 TRINITY_DN9255_c0_g4~~TRINITY_DN9255_c0_g4_i1.p1  ORF type:complete len:856 (+),score=206.30 TRINITY_DN9255_c0_g4_i1:77-2569(+)